MVGRTRRGVLPPWKASDYGRANDIPGVGSRKQNARSKWKRETRSVALRRKRNSAEETGGLTIRDELPPRKIKTRSAPITCLDYGPDRKELWPEFVFCSHCDWWEEVCNAGGSLGKKKQDSRKFACQVEHTNPLYPTLQKPTSASVSRGTLLTPEATSTSNMSPLPSLRDRRLRIPINTWNYNELFTECALQQQMIIELRADLLRVRQEKDRLSQLVAQPMHLVEELVNSKTGQARKRSLVSDILSVFFGDDICKAECLTLLTRYVHQHIYSDFEVLRVMDREGGKINYQSLQLLSNIEKAHKSKLATAYSGTLLPTVYGLKKAAQKVELLGKYRIPFQVSRTGQGAEAIEFRPSDVAHCILTGYGLMDVAEMNSEATLAQAIDGSRFSKALGFVMYGFKVTDYRAMDPESMEPLISPDGSTTSLQSRNNQYPVKMVIGKESASMYEEFRDVINTSTKFSGNREISDGSCERTICLANICTDLSATWKAVGVGGAVKNATFFCHCCSTRSSNCATPNVHHCGRWCAGKPSSWKCFHRDFLDEDTVERCKKEKEALLSGLPAVSSLDDIVRFISSTRLQKSGDDPERASENAFKDPTSIHFNIDACTDRATKVQYSLDVNSDLKLRSMSTGGSLSSRQRRLKEAFVKEKKFLLLCDSVEHGNKRAAALFLTLNNPPCILHLQNRVYLKKLSVVFNKGVNNALGGRLDSKLFSAADDVKPSTKTRFQRFVQGLEDMFNNEIWGTVFAPTHWSLSHDPHTYSLSSLSLDNGKCRTAMQKFSLIADYCLTVEEHREEYKACMELLQILMDKLRQRQKFTDEQIVSFQKSVDEWYQLWHRLEQDNGVTNYIHMLFSGHVSDYLYLHRNLYAFSNQGWEAFNSLIKQVFFRRTARGGGRDFNVRSRLMPLARWLQRRMVFLLVKTESQLENLLLHHCLQEEDNNTGDESDIDDDLYLQGYDTEII